MKCPKCQTENREGASFCEGCGARMEIECPSCGALILMGRKFCGECGHNLTLPSESAPRELSFDEKLDNIQRYLPKGLTQKILSQRERIEGERKQVTVMFCDMEGFTPMVERLGPEKAYSVMDKVYEILIHKVHDYEGTVNEMTGDGIMALFGAPIALEDAPQRALWSALAIHREIAHFNRDKGRIDPIKMRIGVHTGPVVVGTLGNDLRVEFKAVGDTVNLASRMEGLAEPGTTYVTKDTFKLTEGLFRFEPLGEKEVKGKRSAIPVYKLLLTKEAVHRPRLGLERSIYSEMVGRDKELDRLELQVLKAVNGEGSIVNIIGEAGIGKSRLVAELKNCKVIERVSLFEGRAISTGRNLSFHPIIDLLKQWARIGEDDSGATALRKLETAIRLVVSGEVYEILPFVATLMGMKLSGRYAERAKGIEGEALEKLILKNMRDLLMKATELSPLVIVAEDLHWADTSSIELMESLFRLAETQRIVFVNVFRPGHKETGDRIVETIRERYTPHYVEILLQPLNDHMSEILINNMLHIKGLQHEVIDQIVERADGNPFFIEEVVRSFIDHGAVVLRDGAFAVTEKIDAMVIPQTINDVLMARIDRLEEKTRNLVKVASVIGRNFFYRILLEVARTIKDIDNRLEYLKEIQLIRERMRMKELEYLFKHALAQEAAYDSILLQKRTVLHLKVADSIEKVFKERIHDFYGLLAFHYSRGEDLDKTEEYLIKAGEEALRSSASTEALNYYKEGLKLYQKKYGDAADPEKLGVFEKNIAIASYNKGQWENVLKYVDRVLERWGAGSPKNRIVILLKPIYDLIRVCISLYFPPNKKRKIPRKRENEIFDLSYKRAISLVELDPKRCFAEYLSTLRRLTRFDISKVENGVGMWVSASGLFSWTGISFRLSRKMLDYNKEIMNRGNDKEIFYYHLFELIHNTLEGNWLNITKYDDNLVELNLKKGEVWHVSLYLLFHGYLSIYQGAFEDARVTIDRLSEMSEAYGIDYGKEYCYTLRILLALMSGRLDNALNEVNDGISFMIKTSREMIILYYFGFKGIIQALLNDITGAKESVLRAKELIDKQGRVPPIYISTSLLGHFLLHLKQFEHAVSADGRSGVTRYHKQVYQAGKQALKNSKKYALNRAEVLRLMGRYFWLIGKQKEAVSLWTQSMIAAEHLGARVDLAKVYMEIGSRFLENRSNYFELNRINADEYLFKAKSLFKDIGIMSDLAELEIIAPDR